MNQHTPSQQVFDDEFLGLRAKVLELAAALDRVDRAAGPPVEDEKMRKLRAAMETLLRPDAHRAEQIQLLFSRPYRDDWRQSMDV